ncbi:MAG: hypothetical protein JXR96_23765 [Deltaproteobacteria bacterium]|nr:hypothetical protein [Deltaproteobacteria bacterium]
MEESLRNYLAEERVRRLQQPESFNLPVITEARPRPGVNLDDTSELLEIP